MSFGIYFKELTELSYELFRKTKPQFGVFEDKRMVANNINNVTYYSIEDNVSNNSFRFVDDTESSKYEKLFDYYEKTVEPFSNRFQKVEDLEYLYSNAHKFGERDLLTLLLLSIINKHKKQSEIVELLDVWYQKKLSEAKTDRKKSIILELINNTEKVKHILNVQNS